jgi:hypothetical protein
MTTWGSVVLLECPASSEMWTGLPLMPGTDHGGIVGGPYGARWHTVDAIVASA